MRTRLTEMLGCRYPIIQTAMGWVADAKLVAATTNAGGFGFLAGAVMTADEVERGILEIKALTDGPFGVNFHMYVAQAPAIVDLCIKYGVRAVSYSRSPVPALIEKLKAAQIICIPTVGATKHAVKAVSLGADALVVQGSEGGGHTGAVASSILLPDVLSQVSVPVVAAGGYRDGRGLVAALALGAEGIAMGTRFLMTQESPVPEPTKARYVNAVPEQIQVSTKLDGMPQRMIDNPCAVLLPLYHLKQQQQHQPSSSPPSGTYHRPLLPPIHLEFEPIYTMKPRHRGLLRGENGDAVDPSLPTIVVVVVVDFS